MQFSRYRDAVNKNALKTSRKHHTLFDGIFAFSQNLGSKFTWHLLPVILVSVVISLFAALVTTSSSVSAYSINMATDGPVEFQATPGNTIITSSEINVSTTCQAGYNLTLSSSVQDSGLYLDGDSTRTNTLHFTPINGAATLKQSPSTWGYSLVNSSTLLPPTENDIFFPVPSSNASPATIKDPSSTASDADINDTFRIYYGAHTPASAPTGTYTIANDPVTGTAGSLVYYVTTNPVCTSILNITYDKNTNKTVSNFPDASETIEDNENSSVTLSDKYPTRDNLTFKEWNTSADGSGKSFSPGQTIHIGIGEGELSGDVTLYAIWTAEGDFLTINYHGNDLPFDNNETENTVKYYSDGTVTTEEITRYSHTPNIDDEGVQNGGYPGEYDSNDVITIPGVDSLHIVLTFEGYDSPDWLSLWEGAHPDYTARDNYESGFICNDWYSPKYNDYYGTNTVECDIPGDSVTFSFHSDSYYNDYYGYYAVVTAIGTNSDRDLVTMEGSYTIPTMDDTRVFLGWSEDQYATTPTYKDEDDIEYYLQAGNGDTVDLYAIYATPSTVTVNFDEHVTSVGFYNSSHGAQTLTQANSIDNGNGTYTGTVKLYRDEPYMVVSAFDTENNYFFNGWTTTENGVLDNAISSATIYTISGDATLSVTSRRKSGTATLIPGRDLNDRIDYSTKALKAAEALPSGFELSDDYIVSTPDSENPVYVFNDYNNNITYFYTDAEDVYMNEDSSEAFNGLNYLTDISVLADWRTDNVVDMSHMLGGSDLISLDPLANWDTSNVTNMSNMFNGNYRLEDIRALANWDTSNVTNMSYMFNDNYRLEDIRALANWDTGNVVDMSNMFSANYLLHDIRALANWNTGKVRSMFNLFNKDLYITNLDALANWNTGNVLDMSGMFENAMRLTNIDGLAKWDTSSAVGMSDMFSGAISITNLDALANWNTGNVQYMDNMFKNTSSLTDIEGLANWNTSSVIDMRYMFSDAYSITNLDALADWDTSSVLFMNYLFDGTTSLSNLDGIKNWGTSNVNDMSAMFEDTTHITSLDALSHWNTGKVTDMYGMFRVHDYYPFLHDYYPYSSVAHIDSSALADWDIRAVNSFEDMFNLRDSPKLPDFYRRSGTWIHDRTFVPDDAISNTAAVTVSFDENIGSVYIEGSGSAYTSGDTVSVERGGKKRIQVYDVADGYELASWNSDEYGTLFFEKRETGWDAGARENIGYLIVSGDTTLNLTTRPIQNDVVTTVDLDSNIRKVSFCNDRSGTYFPVTVSSQDAHYSHFRGFYECISATEDGSTVSLKQGETYKVTAITDDGYEISTWSTTAGNLTNYTGAHSNFTPTGNNTLTVTSTADTPTHTVTVNMDKNISYVVFTNPDWPTRVAIRNGFTKQLRDGTLYTVTAYTKTGHAVSSWATTENGTLTNDRTNPTAYSVTGDAILSVSSAEVPSHNVTVDFTESGISSVTFMNGNFGTQTATPSNPTVSLKQDVKYRITATTATGFDFTNWSTTDAGTISDIAANPAIYAVTGDSTLTVDTNDRRVLVNYHGNGLYYNNNQSDTNNQVYYYDIERYSHTSNVDNSGKASYVYDDNLNTIDTVTVDGAKSLEVTVYYDTEYSDDYVSVYQSPFDISNSNDGSISSVTGNLSGKLTGRNSNSTTSYTTWYSKTYTVTGDTVKFHFKSDYYSNYYGYYAVITGAPSPVSGTYATPGSSEAPASILGWSEDQDATSPTYLNEEEVKFNRVIDANEGDVIDLYAVHTQSDSDLVTDVNFNKNIRSVGFYSATYGVQIVTQANSIDNGDGTYTGKVGLVANEQYIITATTAEKGVDFDGWFTTGASAIGDTDENPTTYMVTGDSTLSATASDNRFTINYDGNGLYYDGELTNTTNPVQYYSVTSSSHTPNIDEAGESSGAYSDSLDTNEVITIPGASRLHISLTYQTEGGYNDWVSFWEGNHPEYRASSDYNRGYYNCGGSSYTSRYSGTTMRTVECDVNGDSVTFGFTSDAIANNYYGYYAVVTAPGIPTSEAYKIPESSQTPSKFLGWSKNQDDTVPTYRSEADILASYDFINSDNPTTLYAIYSTTHPVTVNFSENISSIRFYSGEFGVQTVTPANSTNNGDGTYTGTVDLFDNTEYTISNTVEGEYYFAGWDTDENGSLGSINDNPTTFTITDTSILTATTFDTPKQLAVKFPEKATKVTFESDEYGTEVATPRYPVVTLVHGADYTVTADFVTSYGLDNWIPGENVTIEDQSQNPTTLRIVDDSTLSFTVTGATPLTINYHGNGLFFDSQASENQVKYYTDIEETPETVYRYSHTENVDDEGVSDGNGYPVEANTNDIITIPGAKALHVSLTYQTNGEYDWVAFWEGAHPEYTAYDYESGVRCNHKWPRYAGDDLTTVECDIAGDAVTFAFYSDSSQDNYYGYYAVVSAEFEKTTLIPIEGEYSIPTSATAHTFLGWSEDQDAIAPTYTDEEDIKANLDARNGKTVDLYAVFSAPTDVTINFEENFSSIGFYSATYGQQVVTPSSSVDNGDGTYTSTISLYSKAQYTITATTNPGFEFGSWETTNTGILGDATSGTTTYLVSSSSTLTATTNDIRTIINYNGNGLYYNNDEAKINNPVYYLKTIETATKYSHTPNVDDEGVSDGNGYSDNADINDVVTIPGASSLHISLTYQTESTSYDWVSFWAGNHPEYDAWSEEESMIECGGAGPLYGDDYLTTIECDIPGDSVTFFFHSDSSASDYYGYYAVVSATARGYETISGTYSVPSSATAHAFLGWSEDQDAITPTYTDEEDIKANLNAENGDIVELYAVFSTLKDVTVNFDEHFSSIGFYSATYGQQVVTPSSSVDNGDGTYTGTVSLYDNAEYTVTATTNLGFEFGSWETTNMGILGDATASTTTYSISGNSTLTATTNDVRILINYNGNGLYYDNDETKINNPVYYANTAATVNKYSHTPNVNDEGISDGNGYTDDLFMNEVVTIPGSSSLHITLTYQTESISYDWVTFWEGSHPEYTAEYDYESGFSCNGMWPQYGDEELTTIECDVPGDTVTFGFRSDGSVSNYYGYYAVISGTAGGFEAISDTYATPGSATAHAFLGWSEDQNATTPTYTDEEDLSKKANYRHEDSPVTLYAVYEMTIPVTVYLDSNTSSVSFANSRCGTEIATGSGDTVNLCKNFPYTVTVTPNIGYRLDSWSTDANGNLSSTTTNPTTFTITDTSVLSVATEEIPVHTATVNFDSGISNISFYNEDYGLQSVSTSGESVSLRDDVEYSIFASTGLGVGLASWSTDTNGAISSTTTNPTGFKVTGDSVLNASSTSVPTHTCTMQYRLQNADGTYPDSYTVERSEPVDYNEICSYTKSEEHYETASGSETVLGDTTISLDLPRAMYELTVNYNDTFLSGVVGAGSYRWGEEIEIEASSLVKSRFTSWSQISGTIGAFGDATARKTTFTMPTSDATIYADGEIIPTHTVTINMDEGVSHISLSSIECGDHQVTTSGSTVSLCDNVRYTTSAGFNDGYTNERWITTSNGYVRSPYSLTTSYTVTGDATLSLVSWRRIATLVDGYDLNIMMKELAEGKPMDYVDSSDKIKAVRMSRSLPYGFTPSEENTVSTADSDMPIYIYFDNTDEKGIIYFYSNALKINMNEISNRAFSHLTELTDISALAYWDTSSVTMMDKMFDEDHALTDIDALSNWDISSVIRMEEMFRNANLTNLNALANWDTSSVTDMSGTFWGNDTSLTNIDALSNWDTSSVTDMEDLLGGNSLLTNIDAISNWDTSNVTNMSGMFYYDESLTNIDALSNWDTSSVTDMSYMFFLASSLTNIDGAGNWDTSSVTTMSYMFYGASSLTNIDGASNWDTSKVTNMFRMFDDASSLTNIDGAGNWDTSSVTTMSQMFDGASSLTNIDGAGNWDTSSVTTMSYMFYGASSLTNIDGASNWDTSKVTNMFRMFDDASSLTNIDGAGNWDTSSVTTMSYMFYGASSLTNIDGASNWDTSSVVYMGHMFSGASSLTNIDGAGSWDTSSVTDMGYMFSGTSSLTNIDGASNWDTSSVTDMSYMFHGASSLTNIDGASNWDTSSVTDMGYMFLGASSLTNIDGASNWDTSSVTTMGHMFYLLGASSLTDIDGARKWNTSNVTDMSYMFYGASSLTNIDALANWDTSSVTTMSLMFDGASSLTNIDGASNWDTSSVTTMSNMFYGASSLTDIDGARKWNTSNVTDMSWMFHGASSLTDIDGASNWDTSSVTDMGHMFDGASSLTNIDALSNWDTSSVTDMGFMFDDASSLTNIDALANWDTSSVIDMRSMFDGASSLTDASGINDWDINAVFAKAGSYYYNNFYSMFYRVGNIIHPEFTKRSGTWVGGTFVPDNTTGEEPAQTNQDTNNDSQEESPESAAPASTNSPAQASSLSTNQPTRSTQIGQTDQTDHSSESTQNVNPQSTHNAPQGKVVVSEGVDSSDTTAQAIAISIAVGVSSSALIGAGLFIYMKSRDDNNTDDEEDQFGY